MSEKLEKSKDSLKHESSIFPHFEKEWNKMIEHEKVKYKSKGFGLFFAILLFIAYVGILPILVCEFYKNFFYPAFSTYDQGKFTFWTIFLTHELTFLIYIGLFYFVYTMKIPFFERYRVSSDLWPWEEDKAQWNTLLKSTIKVILFNHFIIIPITMPHIYFNLNIHYRLDIASLPSVSEFIFQLFFFMVCEDFTFYWVHRTLHHDKLYPLVHKMHHAYKTSITVAAEYSHPLEFLIASVVATNVGPTILGNKVHLVSYLLWVVFRITESLDGHCGYDFSWAMWRIFPMTGSSDYHFFHHKFFNDNYSSLFSYMDRVFGTVNKYYSAYIIKKKIALEMMDKKDKKQD